MLRASGREYRYIGFKVGGAFCLGLQGLVMPEELMVG